jgi:hypothetical protein
VKAAVHKQELVAVNELELHVNRVAVHLAIQRQLILRRTLKVEIALPVFVIVLRERKRLVIDIDRGAVTSKGLVHTFKGRPLGEIKNNTPPAIVIG